MAETNNNTKEQSNAPENKKIIRKLQGIVVGKKMNKTAVVMVESVNIHKKYKKRYIVSKKYAAHDEHNKCKEGDKVTIRQCRPISKHKKWLIINNKE